MTKKVLVTGSRGLVGRRLCVFLRRNGVQVNELDLCGEGSSCGDITRIDDIERGIRDCLGVVHLAAVSRVVWGQKNPDLCWRTNVTGVENLIQVALDQPTKPWVLLASSREVYGHASSLPVVETAQLNPLNIYARSKAEGERIVLQARKRGLQTAVVRLSNVYGCTNDHADRVIPAFVRAALEGKPLRVEGSNHTFDFTHVDDVVRGIDKVIKAMESGDQSFPTVHLVSGYPTSLGELAAISHRLTKRGAMVTEAEPRSYDVAHFYGDPARARDLLDWESEIPLEIGLMRLIQDFRQELALQSVSEAFV